MTAHNEVAGTPAHMDKFMMTDVMRKRWGFEGFYVSDWNDVARINSWHFVAKDFKEASLFSVSAGLDMHMHGPKFAEYIVALVNEGKLPVQRVDYACAKILETKFRLGLFENPFIELEKVDDVLYSDEHQKTALEQARKGIVLQKNSGILPFKKEKIKSIFITGPNADNATTLGDWAAPQPKEKVITVYEGVQKIANENKCKVTYYNSGDRSKKITNKNIEKAVAKAKKADVTVLVLGENSFRHDNKNKTTGENVDRATLKLSGRQLELANNIIATGKPVVVVYISGSPIAEPELENKVKAVVNTWEPGSLGGQAIAEVLFGEVNPSGKLPLTIPRSVGQLQMIYNHKPTAYIHRYNTEKKTPLHPFGFGLSYTTFKLSSPKVSKNKLSNLNDKISVSVNVKNTGERKGEEVVQLYIRDKFSSFTRPVKELKAYKRVALEPGEMKTVTMEITPESLAMYDADYNFVVEPGEFIIMTGNSSANKDLQTIEVSVTDLLTIEKK